MALTQWTVVTLSRPSIFYFRALADVLQCRASYRCPTGVYSSNGIVVVWMSRSSSTRGKIRGFTSVTLSRVSGKVLAKLASRSSK